MKHARKQIGDTNKQTDKQKNRQINRQTDTKQKNISKQTDR